jgi:allantoinase
VLRRRSRRRRAQLSDGGWVGGATAAYADDGNVGLSGFDLLVGGGTVLTSNGVELADVGISDGAIAAIEPDLAGAAHETIDATGLHVFPGVVDPHVHFNDPGRADWEGFETGTAAFAAGGGTCFFDMPLNASPPTVDGASFDLKVEAAKGTALVDFGLWGGLVPGDLDRLDELAERGVIGFKAFMCNTGIGDFEQADDETLLTGMQRAARLGLPVAVHAENDTVTQELAARARAEGRHTMSDYLASRPATAELEAVGRAIAIAEETGCSLHVVHASTAAAVLLVAEARGRGVDVTCETCPHYLLLTDEDAERIGALAKCSPPLRSRAEVEALWSELLAGTIPFVASDHSPAPPGMKEGDDAFAIWGGISGCQTLRSSLLAVSERRGLTLEAIASLTSAAAAERFGLAGKGRLEPGFDADLAIVDLHHESVLAAGDLLYRHSHSAFVGAPLRGRVVQTLLRGQTVSRDGAVAPGPRHGRHVKSR